MEFQQYSLTPYEQEVLQGGNESDLVSSQKDSSFSRSVESLTNQMVVNIIGEVTRHGGFDFLGQNNEEANSQKKALDSINDIK
jgi:hypothetical protein